MDTLKKSELYNVRAMVDTSASYIFNNFSPSELLLDPNDYLKLVKQLNEISNTISRALTHSNLVTKK